MFCYLPLFTDNVIGIVIVIVVDIVVVIVIVMVIVMVIVVIIIFNVTAIVMTIVFGFPFCNRCHDCYCCCDVCLHYCACSR